jgi:hypothetical protein
MITANPDIQIIFACNEGGSIGAAQAVKQSGKKIAVFGTTAPTRSPADHHGELQALSPRILRTGCRCHD